MKKKFLPRLLTALFCLTLLSTAALAEGDTGTDTDTETYVAQASVTKTKYKTFQEAYDACKINTTGAIILLADTGFEGVDGEYATINKDVSLWLNGHTFQSTNKDGDPIPTRVTGGNCYINGESEYSLGYFYGLEVSGGKATLYEIFDNVTLSGGTLVLPSAIIEEKLTITGGNLHLLSAHNATVKCLDVQSKNANVTLDADTDAYPSKFEKITISDGVEYTDLLADGADFSVKLSELGKGDQTIKVVSASHTDGSTSHVEGVCDYCGRQIYVAKIGENGYTSVKAALDAGGNQTVTLLADVVSTDTWEHCSVDNPVTLDLNGHTLGLSINVGEGFDGGARLGNVIIKDSKGNGKLTERLHLGYGKLTLIGGTFSNIDTNDAGTLADMLSAGYMFKDASGNKIELSSLTEKIYLQNVTVVKCTDHSYDDGVCKYCNSDCDHASIDSDNKCAVCGTQMTVYASGILEGATEETGEYFTSLDLACNNGSRYYTTMKLLDDCDESVETYTGATIGIELNGHRLTALKATSTDSCLTVTDCVGTGSIGTLTLEGGADLYGGRYDKITISNSSSLTARNVADLLADGYAYQNDTDIDTGLVNQSVLTGTELTNVKVVKCPHDSTSPCKYCGGAIVAVNNGTYYVSLDTAIAEAKAGDTVKLLNFVDSTVTITDAPKFTLDIGDYAIQELIVENNPILLTRSGTWNNSITTLKTSGGVTIGDLLAKGWGVYTESPSKKWYDSSTTATELEGVRVAPLPIQSVTLFSKKDSYVYRDKIELDFTLSPAVSGSKAYTWYEVDEDGETELPENPVNSVFTAGEHTFRLKVTADSYTATSNDVTVTIGPRTLTPEQIAASAPTANSGLIYDGSAQTLAAPSAHLDGDYVTSYRLGEDGEWGSSARAADAGTYEVYWKLKPILEGCCEVYVGEEPLEVTIDPKTVTATVTIKDKVYTGLTYAEADTVTFTDGNTTYALVADTDFYVNADFADANAGEGKTVTGTVTLTNDNYIFPNGTDELAFTATADIEKADAPTNDLTAVKLYRTVGSTEPQEVSVACVGMPADAGTLRYSVLAGSAYSATIDPQTGMLTVAGVSGAAGDSAQIKVNIESTNYKTTELLVIVKLTDKVQPTLSVEDITTTYTGSTLSQSIIKGTATVDGTTVVGGWSWNGAAPKNVADSGTIAVIFTPMDSTTYSPATTNITVTINKATPPQPTFDPIDPDYDLNWLHDAGKHIDADVDFYWVEENELIVQGKEYHWTITDPNGNYEDLTGSVILWPAPASSGSSGGGGSSSSTTTTTTAKQNPDGSTTVSVSNKDAKSGETVSLPVEVNTEDPAEINVEIPKGSSVTVEIPAENVTPGTVVVIVDEDGNETVVATTGLTENGVTVTLTENCTIKVIENATDFDDVPEGSYYGDAVAWASARGITGGVGGNNFGAENDCGRAQLVTFLWRAAGQPEASGDQTFSDVDDDAYYTEAVKWAASLDIVTGYDSGLFGTNDVITREQMAVILYRFAQAVGLDTTQEDTAAQEYDDYEEISDYAVAAMQWAVNFGVMQGYDGNLMPGAECTRAQIVTMLYRLLGM